MFAAYLTWEKSESGFYLFDPNKPPYPFEDLYVTRVVKYEGPVYKCMHSFIQKNYYLETLKNAFFENKVCIEKNHIDRFRQTVNAKGVIGHEILMKTHAVAFDG